MIVTLTLIAIVLAGLLWMYLDGDLTPPDIGDPND